MSYARLIQLLGEKKIKRIFIMADGQVAIIEVCLCLCSVHYFFLIDASKSQPIDNCTGAHSFVHSRDTKVY